MDFVLAKGADANKFFQHSFSLAVLRVSVNGVTGGRSRRSSFSSLSQLCSKPGAIPR